MGDQTALVKDSDQDRVSAVTSPSLQLRLLKLSSRFGAWGLLVGAYSFSGMPLPQRFHMLITGLGLLLGGVGTFVASSIVSLQLRGRFRILELSAILGLALGAAAGFLGTVMLFGVPSSLGRLVVLAWLWIPVLGLALVLLFGVGVAKRLFTKEGSGPE